MTDTQFREQLNRLATQFHVCQLIIDIYAYSIVWVISGIVTASTIAFQVIDGSEERIKYR